MTDRRKPPAVSVKTAQAEKIAQETVSATAALQRQRPWLVATLLLYALLQFLYITATPLQTITLPDNLPPKDGGPQSLLVGIGPDEKEYLIYIRSLSENGRLPAPAPRYRHSPDEYVSYQAQHPPLFFCLAAFLEKLGASHNPAAEWYLLRVLCALFGGAVVVLVARAAAIAFPGRNLIVLAAPPAAAFVPMFGHITGNLSNEPMAMALTAWAWLQMVRLVRGERAPTMRETAILGMTLGLAILTRLTAVMWLPAAALCVWYAASRAKKSPLVPLASCLGIAVFCLGIWLARNQVAYGTPLLRTFDRPLMAYGSLADFLGPGIAPPHAPMLVGPLTTSLWYASTAWFPYWLVQFYLPGGLRAAPAFQAILLIVDVVLALLLFLHASQSRRGETGEAPDPGGRILLWGASVTLSFCILALLQQQLFSDWNVVNSPGRYLVAALPASTLLFLFALSTRVRRGGGSVAAAAAVAAILLVFDLYTAFLVRQFYGDHPEQAAVQPIEQARLAQPSSCDLVGRG